MTQRPPPEKWTADQLFALGRSYQPAAVLLAAAELDLFTALAAQPLEPAALAQKLHCDTRALTILLDALTALQLLQKKHNHYALLPGTQKLLTQGGRVLGMSQHQANCLRRWADLARVVQSGQPTERRPSIRGEAGDAASFIEAMDNISRPLADKVIKGVKPLKFKHLLDLGGGSGTWAIAFLRACPNATATLFDLPHVIPMAKQRLSQAGLLRRVKLLAGDFMADPLPGGADLAWVSAIVHQNSRAQNRQLFANIFQALTPAGRIAIRDVVMEPDRLRPAAGALFAINMLVATPGGSTYTFDELRADLEAAGFGKVALWRRDEGMNALLGAARP